MPIDTIRITDDQVARVLALPEGHFSDMKARQIAPAKLTKTLSAFANADGGELYVGVSEDDGSFRWDGFRDVEDANGHLQVFDQLFPLGDGFNYEFLEAPGAPGVVLHITVLRSRVIRRASDGTAYLRRSAG